jgi:hypothetical protein
MVHEVKALQVSLEKNSLQMALACFSWGKQADTIERMYLILSPQHFPHNEPRTEI